MNGLGSGASCPTFGGAGASGRAAVKFADGLSLHCWRTALLARPLGLGAALAAHYPAAGGWDERHVMHSN